MTKVAKLMKQWPVKTVQTMKTLAKLALKSHRFTSPGEEANAGRPLIVLGNGPSLAQTIEDFGCDVLVGTDLMAVNFAACTPEFVALKPRYYVLADPTFFAADAPEKVMALWQNFADLVAWPMMLFVPFEHIGRIRMHNKYVKVEGFNFIGAEGFGPICRKVYDSGRAMPRPRNVLIPAIMLGISLGYKEIYLCGADHTWTRSLSVDRENRLITIQPHFYKDDDDESQRVAQVYRDIHMHDILLSFHIAFKSYFTVEDYARRRGVNIYNATPGSFIDAFRRRGLESLKEVDDNGVGDQPEALGDSE